MGLVNLPIGASNSGTNDWSDVHGEDQAIVDEVNGSLDANNLAANAVTTTKITDAAVTSAKMVITYYTDTQTSLISSDGVLTGISVTPTAGTYFAIATARLNANTADDAGTAALSLRVAGSNVTTGPLGAIDDLDARVTDANLVVQGVITPTGAQAVEVYGDITVVNETPIITGGALTLIRLA